MQYRQITVKIASWGTLSPCCKKKAVGLEESLYFWKCKIDEIGRIVKSELLRGGLHTLNELTDEKWYFVSIEDAKQYVIQYYRIKDEKAGVR